MHSHTLYKTASPQTSNSNNLFLSANHDFRHLLLVPFFSLFSIQLTTLPFLFFSGIPLRFVPSFLTTEDQMSAVSDSVLSSSPCSTNHLFPLSPHVHTKIYSVSPYKEKAKQRPKSYIILCNMAPIFQNPPSSWLLLSADRVLQHQQLVSSFV